MGVWERVFQHLANHADNEYAMIDSTIVRAFQHSAGAKGGSHLKKRLVAAKAIEHQNSCNGRCAG
jgi:transposase